MITSRNGEETDHNTEEAKAAALAAIDQAIATINPEEVEAKIRAAEEIQRLKATPSSDYIRAMRLDAGIPERYLEASFNAWSPEGKDQEEFKGEVNRWKAGPFRDGASAVFRGTHGAGKTWLACGLVSDALGKGLDAFYITAKAYTGKIKETYRKDARDTESGLLERFSGFDLLVVDEVGRQFETQSEHLYLFDLVNERYNCKRPTIFVTNLDGEEFKRFVGEAILDRLKEGGSTIITMNWASRRI